MQCDAIEVLISAYVDGEVTEEEKHTLEEHLNVCRECRMILSDFTALHSLCGELEPVKIPGGFRQRTTQQIDAEPKQRFAFVGKFSHLAHGLSLALFMILCGTVLVIYTPWFPPRQIEEERGAIVIDVYAEDILFALPLTQETNIVSVGEGRVAEDILNTIDFSETQGENL